MSSLRSPGRSRWFSAATLWFATVFAGPALLSTANANANAGAAAPAAASVEVETLRAALASMAKLTSYHAKAVVLIGKQKALLEGDWGVGKVGFNLQRMDGKKTTNIVIGSAAFVSSDGGKTWAKEPPDLSVLLSNMVTAPISPAMRLADRGAVKSLGEEMIEGVKTSHLQLQAASPVDIWVADDAKFGKVVRKIHIIIKAEDGEFDATVIYGAYNQPVQIVAPPVK